MKTLLILCATALLVLSCGQSPTERIRAIADATIASLDTVQTQEGYKQVKAVWKSRADAWGAKIRIQDVEGAKIGAILLEVRHAFQQKELQFLSNGFQRIYPNSKKQNQLK